MSVVTLQPRIVGENIRWDFSFFNPDGSAVDMSGSGASVTLAIEISNATDPALNPTATLSATPTVAPQAYYVLTAANWVTLALAANANLYVVATALTASSGGSTYKDEFYQPVEIASASNAALVDVNLVAQAVYGLFYANLETNQKVVVDQAVLRARDRVGQVAQFWLYGGPNAYPDSWKEWANSEAIAALVPVVRPERIQEAQLARREARQAAMAGFTTVSADTLAILGTTFTLRSIRQYVVAHCVRRDNPVYPDTHQIDSHTQNVLNRLWNGARWRFRERQVYFTIAASQSQSITSFTGVNSGEEFDSLATRMVYLSNDPGCPLREIKRDQFARLISDTTVSSGQPEAFRIINNGATFTWWFFPTPDTTYTAYAAIFIKGPKLPSGATAATDTAELAKFPPEFHPVIKEYVLNEVLDAHHAPGAAERTQRVERALSALLPTFVEVGAPDDDKPNVDIYGDNGAFTSATFNNWWC